MYTMLLILMATFGNQTVTVTVSIDHINGLEDCQTMAYIVAQDFDGFNVEEAHCVPENTENGDVTG